MKNPAANLVKDLFRVLTGKAQTQRIEALTQDPKAFTKLKAAELFASPARRIQIFFTDLFGVPGRYNTPGTAGDINWRLRLPNNPIKWYFNKVAQGKALNWPEILGLALDARGEKATPLTRELKKYQDILSEKSRIPLPASSTTAR